MIFNFDGQKPDETQDNELNQWSLYDRHPRLQENGCVLPSVALPDEHLYGTLRRCLH